MVAAMSNGPIPPIAHHALDQPEAPKPVRPPRGIEQWTRNVQAGFARMAIDPDYRRSIQCRVS
jgi:hypothetical protein